MPISLATCAKYLSAESVRHHVDLQEGVIRVVFLTRSYTNPRGEKMAVLRLELPDGGYRCRVTVERAFSTGRSPAATCLTLCRLAAATPLVGVEYDAEAASLRIVAETVVEDGELTRLQLLSMIDRVVEAAEAWQAAVSIGRRRLQKPRLAATNKRRGAA
ncbi:MAG: hypothetical protein EBR23_06125 [Planctomycetia bacterium]|nr:hypothetical protein [Planctomycetia bacterium]